MHEKNLFICLNLLSKIGTQLFCFYTTNVYFSAFSEFLVDLMGAPGTLIPADILSVKETTFKPVIGAYLRAKPLLGEGSSQDAALESTLLLDRNYCSANAESIPSSFPGTSGDTAEGSSDIIDRPTSNHVDNLASSGIGTSLYKGSRVAQAVGDGARMNLNVAPYNQNSPEDLKSLFAELNPFQIKGTGKTSVHNKPAENKVDELQRQRNNPVSGRPPVPLMWKNRYACNEVPRKKDYDYMEGLLPRMNRELNDYNLQSLASSSSATSVKIYGDGFKSSGNSNISSKNSDASNSVSVTSSLPEASTSQFNRLPFVEDLNTNKKGEVAWNGEELQSDTVDVVKEQEENEIGFHDRRKLTHDRFMGTNLKLKDPESPSSSVDSSRNRADQIFDDVDVGDEILWEDLVIGERIGIGNIYSLVDVFLKFGNLGSHCEIRPFHLIYIYAYMHMLVCRHLCVHSSVLLR